MTGTSFFTIGQAFRSPLSLASLLTKNRLLPSTIPSRIWMLGKESEQTGGHECSPPDHVEVEPSLAEKREAELTIDCPRDQPCDGKIADRMDSRGEHSCERVGSRRHVTMACHMALCFDRAAAQQHRQHHQTCAVR